MKNVNLKLSVLMLSALTLGAVSCKKEGCTDSTATNYDSKAKKDDGSCTYAAALGTVEKSGHITANETWTSNNIYVLNGKVVVDAGVTLTIEPGTIIKGAEGSDVNASALIIAQGAKINAEGTAAKPIIFTSVLDDIEQGELAGSNLTEADFEKWGGLIILGKAPVSAADGDVIGQIEGIPATDAFGAYGGSDAADNSGVLKYVSIRHGGALIGSGNEINGLTLGGVGSGTTIENIEIFATLDDGVELFGGTVNIKNLLVGFQGDDGVDIDQNYAGTVDNFYVLTSADGDEGMEVDGPENTTNTTGMFTLKNGTCYKETTATKGSGDFKDKAQGTLNNVMFGTMKIRANFDANNSCASKTDTYTHVMATPQTFSTTGTQFDAISVYTSSTCTLPGTYQSDVEGKLTSATATGASTSVFANWTIMSIKGKL
jgi:hypothetical protein